MRQLAEGIAYLHACKPMVQLFPNTQLWLQQLLDSPTEQPSDPIKDDVTALLRRSGSSYLFDLCKAHTSAQSACQHTQLSGGEAARASDGLDRRFGRHFPTQDGSEKAEHGRARDVATFLKFRHSQSHEQLLNHTKSVKSLDPVPASVMSHNGCQCFVLCRLCTGT